MQKTVTIGAYVPIGVVRELDALARRWPGFVPSRSQLLRMAIDEMLAQHKPPDTQAPSR